MLLQAPKACKTKRLWHFKAIFPIERLEYCTNVWLEKTYGEGAVPVFDAISFFGAHFAIRRLRISTISGYSNDPPWLRQTEPGKAFSKIPKHIFLKWRACVRGHLPLDRQYFLGSLLGARNREYGVCRIKEYMLRNARSAREEPSISSVDEQIARCRSKLSGAKKRLPKKNSEGLEYYTIATSNKLYKGYKDEIREESKEGDVQGKVIRPADPVCGGYILNYFMDGGPRYEVGTTAASKTFGMLLLVFTCGSYLRYNNAMLVTDSAYGFLEGMCILRLWNIFWVSSLRISQRTGFLGIKEIADAGTRGNKKKDLENQGTKKSEKRSMKKDVSRWEKENKDTKKGTSWI